VGMSSRGGAVMIWSCYFALGCAHLARQHYWSAAIWIGLGLIWFLRAVKASRLDDLSSDTLGLKPQRRALFSPERIFAQS
jgi:hypothetical protein